MGTLPDPRYRLDVLGEGRFALSGALTLATAPQALEAGERAFGALQSIEIGLAGVDAVDSAGLAVLLEWVRWARLQGRRLKFAGLPEGLRAIANISEVDGILRAAEEAPGPA